MPVAGENWFALSRDCEPGRPADDAAGLSVSVLRVVPQPTAAEVVHLRVEGRLREAEVVRPVVHAVVHRVQVCARRIDVVQLRRRERGRVTAALVPLVRPRVHVVAGGRKRVVDALLVADVRIPLLRRPCVVAAGHERRSARRWVYVPRKRRRAVCDRLFAPRHRGSDAPAPEVPGVVRRVIERRIGGEHLPRRVVGSVLHDAVAHEQRTVLGVDVAHRAEWVRGHDVHDQDLVGPPNAVRRRRHPDEANTCRVGVPVDVHRDPAVLPADFRDGAGRLSRGLGRGAYGVLRREDDRVGQRRVGRQRRRQESDLAVDDAHGYETVASGFEAAERLAKEHGAPLADRRCVDELELGELIRAQPQQLAVLAQVLPRRYDVVGRQARGEVRARRRTGLRARRTC